MSVLKAILWSVVKNLDLPLEIIANSFKGIHLMSNIHIQNWCQNKGV